MEAIPAQIAMQMAIVQKNAAMSMVKQTAEMQQQIVDTVRRLEDAGEIQVAVGESEQFVT